MNLQDLRRNIDRVDHEILALLNRRMELVLRTKKLKTEITESCREEEIYSRVRSNTYDLLEPEFALGIYEQIVSESKRLQGKELCLIGFQGEHGAYSEMAVRQYCTEAVPIPHGEFGDVFEGVKSGVLDLGIVPVENSLAGNVTQVDDLLTSTDLHIIGEVRVDVHHCLLALPDTDYREIRVVYSHPQALAQCRGFLTRTDLEVRPYYDTAGSAMMLARERPAATAVIASKLCAQLYNLEILKENIEDHKSNRTRFLVLSKTPNESGGDKCSVVFAVTHTPGSLLRVIQAFSDNGVNMTRIESRPLAEEPGRFAFLLDFQGRPDDRTIEKMFAQIRENTTMFRVLGWYEEAQG